MSELLSFFCTKPLSIKELCASAGGWLERAFKTTSKLARRALSRRNTYCLSVDARGPYFVVPESGSMQK